jgi:hypothetical protein
MGSSHHLTDALERISIEACVLVTIRQAHGKPMSRENRTLLSRLFSKICG